MTADPYTCAGCGNNREFCVCDLDPPIGLDSKRPGPTAPALDEHHLTGVLWDVTQMIAPATEASRAALLFVLATEVGNLIGRSPHCWIDGARHTCGLYTALVGPTSRGRKGTAGAHVRRLTAGIEEDWPDTGPFSGFGSGEGFLAELGAPDRTDHRMLIDEHELASLLAATSRDGSTLSPYIRAAWDGTPLRQRVKKAKIVVSEYHVSAVGHITDDEARTRLTVLERANGFGNRWLWIWTERSQLLPFGGELSLDTINECVYRLTQAVDHAGRVGEVTLADDTRDDWAAMYYELAEHEPLGIVGALTTRREAYIRRLAMLHCVVDVGCSGKVVLSEHLASARAMWDYAEASVRHIWGETTGDRDIDKLVEAVQAAASDGLSMSDAYYGVFARHRDVGPIAERAAAAGLIRVVSEASGGRPRTVMYAVRGRSR